MKANVLIAPGQLEVKDWPIPEPKEGEVLVRITLAGICGSDYAVYSGKFEVPLPVIPGHEGIGVVHKIGPSVKGVAVGQRVVIQPNFACRSCAICSSGHDNVCPEKVRLGLDTDGVFAEYARVPADYVWPIPDDLEDQSAVFTEPTAVALRGLRTTPPARGDRTLILGAGVIGLLILQLAALEGAETTAADLLDERLAVARSTGATHTIRADDAALEPASYDLIYEASGAPSALADAIRLAAPGGRIVLLGLPSQEHPVSSTQIVRKELTVSGSMIYTDEFPHVLEILRNRKVQTGPLTTGIISLDDLAQALERFQSPERVKTLVSIGGNPT